MAKSFLSALNASAKTSARQQRQAEQRRNRLQRETEMQAKAADRARKKAERDQSVADKQARKESEQHYVEARIEEVDDLNQDLVERIDGLKTVLEHTLTINDTIDFESLRVKDDYQPFNPPFELVQPKTAPTKEQFTSKVKPQSFLEKTLATSRYQKEMQAAEVQFNAVMQAHQASETERLAKLEELRNQHIIDKAAFEAKKQQRGQEVDELQAAYQASEIAAVASYNSMVLERSEYPDSFPQNFRVAYVPDSKELAIEYQLPSVEVVPTALEYKYNKSKDSIDQKPRKPAEIKEIYQDVVAALSIRTIHEVLEADQGQHIEIVVFNGVVESVDPATGKDIRPCVISLRVTRNAFSEINLARIDKKACLRNLGAQVSSRPEELQPVKPIVEFNMVDKRFIEQGDVLSELEARPNLMDLTPSEFENLVSNLFSKMGLETKLTRASKDGGVDAVAFDPRPILGGKVVIQAKRYRNTVGVSAVRDLFGTMMNEGASKGIIVATSSYGPDAYNFSKDKPMELIDGGGLLYLLDQIGVKARIIMPNE